MTYIVIELQTNDGVTTIVPPVPFTDRNAAESKFHQTLQYAAVSSIESHAVTLLTEDGRTVRTEVYHHPKPEPEPEEEGGEEEVGA